MPLFISVTFKGFTHFFFTSQVKLFTCFVFVESPILVLHESNSEGGEVARPELGNGGNFGNGGSGNGGSCTTGDLFSFTEKWFLRMGIGLLML